MWSSAHTILTQISFLFRPFKNTHNAPLNWFYNPLIGYRLPCAMFYNNLQDTRSKFSHCLLTDTPRSSVYHGDWWQRRPSWGPLLAIHMMHPHFKCKRPPSFRPSSHPFQIAWDPQAKIFTELQDWLSFLSLDLFPFEGSNFFLMNTYKSLALLLFK